MQLDFWHTIAEPCLEPCKNHLSGPISSQMEHCEHSRWSCQRNNSSLRINFSVRKKVSLCFHRIMAFICNLDLGWLLSNAFSLCYQEGKKPVQFAGSFTGSNGASRSPPSLPWALLEEAWEQGKGLKKPSWREVGAVQGVGNKQGFLIRKEYEDKHPCVLSCPGVSIQGTEGVTVTAVSGH